MYIPTKYQLEDSKEQYEFMIKYSFATLLNFNGNQIIGSHIPLIVEQSNDMFILYGHVSKLNSQSDIECGSECLAIFQGPHAYISPSQYDNKGSFPTWDYIAVHAYGTFRKISNKFEIIEKTIAKYEKAYFQHWNEIPLQYKINMMEHIETFRIDVHEMQAQKKLSQNKTASEIKRIKNTLSTSQNPYALDLSTYL